MTRLEAALAELAAAIREEVGSELAQREGGPPELLSIEQAARRLGIGRTAAYALMDRGDLRSIKLGRRRLVPANSLAAITDRVASP